MTEGYNFSTAGLASSAGKLELFRDEELIDSLCWGGAECFEKFATDAELNNSLVRQVDNFVQEKYYPEARQNQLEVEELCGGLEITEIYSYYENEASEQFVEIYNKNDDAVDLSRCFLRFKNKDYALGDIELMSEEYYAARPVALTKDPTSSLTLDIVGSSGVIIDSASYSHGQKKDMSLARFSDEWYQTYAITPGAENIRQDFRACEDGKVLNGETGNCVKEEEDDELGECKEGYERNPETNRCRKIQDEESELTPCADGYERNPETNRCRKITSTDDPSDYPPSSGNEAPYTSPAPRSFVALAALIAAIVVGVGYIIYQYRKEIKKFFSGILKKRTKLV